MTRHYIYKTTNIINGRFYIGMHSSRKIQDGYLGSGKRLKLEINKYGKENFRKTILEELPSREALKNREKEIVNEDLLKDPLCINLKYGGEGGWEHVNSTGANITGFVRDDTYWNKISKARTGKKLNISQENRRKMSELNYMKTTEGRLKIKRALTGSTKTTEHKLAISNAIKLWHKERKRGIDVKVA